MGVTATVEYVGIKYSCEHMKTNKILLMSTMGFTAIVEFSDISSIRTNSVRESR